MLSTIISYLIVIAVLIIFLKIISLPFRIILRFIINSIIGGIILAICSYFGILIAVNWWTIVLTGLLGVPGLVIAIIITMFI